MRLGGTKTEAFTLMMVKSRVSHHHNVSASSNGRSCRTTNLPVHEATSFANSRSTAWCDLGGPAEPPGADRPPKIVRQSSSTSKDMTTLSLDLSRRRSWADTVTAETPSRMTEPFGRLGRMQGVGRGYMLRRAYDM